MSDITILIQGPLDEISISAVQYYKTIGPIVISYWDNSNESLLEELKNDTIIYTKNKLPGTKEYKQATADMQFWSVYHGLAAVQTKFVIRTRSDEWYGNLDPLIAKLDINKIICGNIFFKRWSNFQNHIGDHLFIGETAWLLEAYRLITHEPEHFRQWKYAEQILTYGLARSKNMKAELTKDYVKSMIDVIDINELKPFIAQYRAAKQTYKDFFHDPSVIKNIAEL